MDSAWFRGQSEEAERQQAWYKKLGSGVSPRSLDLPIPLTKRMVRHFLHAPKDSSVDTALRWGQVMGLGGEGRLAKAILVAAGFVVVNVVLGNLVEPQLMGRTLGMSTLVIFLSLVFWGWLWGPVGMFLSVPLTMILKIGMENSRDLKQVAIMLDSARAAAERLKTSAEEDEGSPAA